MENTVLYLIQKHAAEINGSTSFMWDNMEHLDIKNKEQEGVPRYSEIQNKMKIELWKTFNLHSNSTMCPRCVVSQSVLYVIFQENNQVSPWRTLILSPFNHTNFYT